MSYDRLYARDIYWLLIMDNYPRPVPSRVSNIKYLKVFTARRSHPGSITWERGRSSATAPHTHTNIHSHTQTQRPGRDRSPGVEIAGHATMGVLSGAIDLTPVARRFETDAGTVRTQKPYPPANLTTPGNARGDVKSSPLSYGGFFF